MTRPHVFLAVALAAGCAPAGLGSTSGGDRPYEPGDDPDDPAGDPGEDGPADDPTPGGDPEDGPQAMPEDLLVDACGDGRDDDGDGEVDEDCPCMVGDAQPCYGGAPELAGVGACALGAQACDTSLEFGSWGECAGWIEPTEEVCDGVDNDCDGTADEGCSCAIGETRGCYTGPPGTEGVGICAPGEQACAALPDGSAGWGECVGSVLPEVERCDGIDNDCDGAVDEGCGCAPGDTRSCYETPDGRPGEGTPGVGICREGAMMCIELPGGGSDWSACVGAVFPEPETCGDGIDDDCDGAVDEGCMPTGVGTTVDCSTADVLFLVDTTGSMGGEISQIQSRLRDTIIPGIAAEIADATFSVASFDDFPRSPYGSGGDVPFRLVQATTASVPAAQAAVNTLRAAGGADAPESHVEALYQTASGAGIGTWVGPRSCPAGTVGYPCFRAAATKIVVLITDAPFHNGPAGANPYSGVFPAPHTYGEAVAALRAIDAKVVGLFSGFGLDRLHLEEIARDTGALDPAGAPIVIDIGTSGSGLGPGVVEAIAALCD